ncbi:MAG: S8 family serine peptidase [Muribaculaceae bacterium]|nr:S8 family serine peptidase [Muribaculaceae bacterium]
MRLTFPSLLIYISVYAGLLTCSLQSFAAGTYSGDSEEIRTPDDTYYAAIIELDDNNDMIDLEKEGVIILRQRGQLLLCYVPNETNNPSTRAESSKDLHKIEGVKNIHRGRRTVPSMDRAVEWFEASAIHTGISLPAPYTGKGVVTGICDIGIDPLHVAFLDAEGESRIKRLVQYIEGDGKRIDMHTAQEYAEWETDTRDNWHATHVAGIMAGSYGRYSGMAPDSEIVITTSHLSDVGLLCGAEDILEYAKECGKPAVINMSMGNFIGPHDGSSLFSRYLDLIGEEATVVLSAGNAGNMAISLRHTFSTEKDSAALAIYSTDWVQFNPYGAVDIWSLDSSPLKVRLGIRDSDRGEDVIYYPWQSLQDGQTYTITSDPCFIPSSPDDIANHDPDFAGIYKGWFSISGGIDRTNGRYHAILEYDAHTDIMSDKGRWARYVPVVEIAGESGTTAEIYADGQYTVFRQLPGEPAPGSLLSFSDLATGNNLISVGMFINRDSLPLANGEIISTGEEAGTISPHSSYATLADGRVMPITVAPGQSMISAISNPYLEANPDSETINLTENIGGKEYSWATCSGTSMSSPYVAGAIACWLEALPGLDIDQIKEIVAASNRHDYPDRENPRHGSGWFDPLQGLKYAFDRFSSVSVPDNSGQRSRLSYSDRILTLWNPGLSNAAIDIYAFSGEKIVSYESSLPSECFSLDTLPPGLYIASLRNSGVSIKVLLK